MPTPFVLVKSKNGLYDVKQVNSEYFVWKRFDELLMSWLLASISKDMFSNVANCLTTSDV